MPVKCLTVFYHAGKWYGQEIEWKRSGSGSYREVFGIEIPQARREIERFAAENGYLIQWRGPIPEEEEPETPSNDQASASSNGDVGQPQPEASAAS